MGRRIIIAGGTGYLGTLLSKHFLEGGDEVIILSRKQYGVEKGIHYRKWDGETRAEWVEVLEGSDILINLSGKNVNCRYNRRNREAILHSRLASTSILGKAIAELKRPPAVWINAASATIYRHAEDSPQDELTGELGEGFSVEVCKAWEACFLGQQTQHTRKVILRTGMVMGERDEVSSRLIGLVKLGLGGSMGNGRQKMAWLHEEDFIGIVEWVIENGKDGMAYNATAPATISNAEMMATFRNELHRPFGLPASRLMLEVGAFLIGTETELVLKSRWVYPKRLLEQGYRFRHTEAVPAFKSIIRSRLKKVN